jgi:hypothetical protein
MGQYYNPIILTRTKKNIKAWAYSHDYDNGLKLMEHSWKGNTFVDRIVTEIIDKPLNIVWAGDYADAELDKEGNKRKDKDGYDINLNSLCKKSKQLPKENCNVDYDEYRFFINHDRNEYVDMSELPLRSTYDDFEYRVHPLPLLTCEGNGRGGGDYGGSNISYVGRWARDRISLSNTIEKHNVKIVPDFKE